MLIRNLYKRIPKLFRFTRNSSLISYMEPDNKEEKKQEVPPKNDKPHEEKPAEDDPIINPYEIVNTSNKEIDYSRLVKKFGLNSISDQQIERY
jgi:hypothetical protein